MMTITFQLEKLTCPSCMQKIIDNVNELTEIETIKILFDRSKARVVFEDNKISEEEILHKIEETGYSAKKI